MKEEIEENLRKEVEAGRMFGPFTKEEAFETLGFFRTSPLGAVRNGDGSMRPINDLSFPRRDPTINSVNASVDKDEFITTWDDFDKVVIYLLEVKGAVLLGIFDWAKAYRQIPTNPYQWPFLMILTFDEEVMLDTRITFGGVAGCGSFGNVADKWKEIMRIRFRFPRAFRWVDDTMFVKPDDGSNDTKMVDVVRVSEEMGVVTNPTKWLEFSYEQKYLGMVWNGKEKTVGLDDKKRVLRINQIKEFMEEKKVNFKQTEKLAGRLNHATLVYPQMRCHCMALYRWMSEWMVRMALRDIPEEIIQDLERWMTVLKSADPRRLIPSPGVTNVAWVGDASTSYGIGIIIGVKWSRFRLRRGWDAVEEDGSRRDIAWAETVALRLGLIMLCQLKEVQGREFLVLTDNVVTEGAVRNGKSKNRWVNREWIKIQDKTLRLNCRLKQMRVKSADNAADLLSRGFDSSKRVRDMMYLTVPVDLRRFIVQE